MKVKKKKTIASFGLLVATLIWGFAFVVVKDALDYVPPVYMLAFRFTIASIGLLFVFSKRLRMININNVKSSIVLGILLYISYLLQTIGCLYTTAGKNAFITTIYVVIVPFLYWLISKQKPDIYCLVSAFMAIIGIGLLSLNSDLSINLGDVLTLLCGFGYAIHLIYINKYSKYQDPIILTFLQILVAAILSWLTAPIMDGGFPVDATNPNIMVGMLYLGIGSTMIAYLLQNIGQKYIEPSTAALLLSMESVFGAIFSVLILKEIVTIKMLIGCSLIFTAVIMAETKFEFIRLTGRKRSIDHA
ncbi:DMT family transporter [Candidatus Galacturonibacter soehngenii]|uniref:EamA family transporter n=1 Tax=Candidatus Galacturonatibacter soehngenii TaxID=2307010 RepID=A0A7V7QNI6_9FIRM|nr:EamA family transporter [Candidatus Galacturonibacter soehngenii]KAB1440600.1 EamA family transporter [Candidatus Galacturonibacter soehngenii]